MEGVIGEKVDVEAKQASAAAVEAEQNAVLAKITGVDVDTPAKASDAPVPKEGRSRDTKGQFKTTEESTGTLEPTKESVNPADYDKALKALQLDNVPESILGSMSQAELTVWGLSRSKNHADTQKVRDDLSTLRKLKTEPEAVPTDSVPDEGYLELTEYYGEEGAAPIKKMLSARDAKLDKLMARIDQQDREFARRDMDKEYNLSDPERWKIVTDARAADVNEYASEADAIRAAATLAFADERLADLKSRLANEHSARSNGQSTTESQVSTPGDTLTGPAKMKDLEDQLLTAITKSDDAGVARIRKEMGTDKKVSALELMTRDGLIGVPS